MDKKSSEHLIIEIEELKSQIQQLKKELKSAKEIKIKGEL